MPERRTIERARAKQREGKAPTTQAGEFVREEIEHVRQGKHGARSSKQAIAIGLSKARRAGVPLPPQKGASAGERRKEEHDVEKGRGRARPKSARRSRAVRGALQREGHTAGSRESLARQARSAARGRTSEERSAAAKKAARARSPAQRRAAARKAAATRAKRRAEGASR